MTAEPTYKPLQQVLLELDRTGLMPRQMFLARLGARVVRVVEIVDAFVIIQPVDDPRWWELAPIELILVNPPDIQLNQLASGRRVDWPAAASRAQLFRSGSGLRRTSPHNQKVVPSRPARRERCIPDSTCLGRTSCHHWKGQRIDAGGARRWWHVYRRRIPG